MCLYQRFQWVVLGKMGVCIILNHNLIINMNLM